jgi:hypothetical protein
MRNIDEIKADISYYTEKQNGPLLKNQSFVPVLKELDSKLRRALVADIPIDRLEALCTAERDGRCVVLPCKVRDTVFITTHDSPTGIEQTKINRIVIKRGRIQIDADCVHDDWGRAAWVLNPSDFGKTVFHTREAAKAALKGGTDNA